MFSRLDNHLRHCTGHRPPPPPPQQQQQHTTAPPPMFTINHQYTSMGGAVERNNINMQVTQHLDQLSTAPTPSYQQWRHSTPNTMHTSSRLPSRLCATSSSSSSSLFDRSRDNGIYNTTPDFPVLHCCSPALLSDSSVP